MRQAPAAGVDERHGRVDEVVAVRELQPRIPEDGVHQQRRDEDACAIRAQQDHRVASAGRRNVVSVSAARMASPYVLIPASSTAGPLASRGCW